MQQAGMDAALVAVTMKTTSKATAGITKSRSGHYTAWAKSAMSTYADASISKLELVEARAHKTAMLAAIAGVTDPREQATKLYAYQRANS